MTPRSLPAVRDLLDQVAAELEAVSGPTADDGSLLAVLAVCEGGMRLLERVSVGAVADLDRQGAFLTRGYRSTPKALCDLLGLEWAEARRRVVVAEQACPRVGLDGTVSPALLEQTAKVFAAGDCSLRQVEVVADVLGSAAARRLDPDRWAAAELAIAAVAGDYSPRDLRVWATALVDTLDADGPEPDDREPVRVNEVFLTRNPSGSGGRIKGRIDDAAMFDAIASVVDAGSAPVDADDSQERSVGQRQAEALAGACGYVLDHADSDALPTRGGERPHLNVTVSLADLQNRARAGCLDMGGTLSPEQLRMLCCDARVVPIVLGGAGQPLDVGRATPTIPDGLRRAVQARDRGCARCGRPAGWCEIHHLIPWEHDGPTSLDNCVSLCRSCHRLVHHGGWDVRLHHGIPQFLPPPWIDPHRTPRQRPPHLRPAEVTRC